MIIISGPSTVGKNPFIYRACQLYDLKYITPCTTRKIRPDEKNGVDYCFLSKHSFQSKIHSGEITEWDYCLGNYYGYTFGFPGFGAQITHGLSRMAIRIKMKYPKETTTIFMMPSSTDQIYNNLRQIYTGKSLMLREELVEEEICHSVLFDKVFIRPDSLSDIFKNEEMMRLLDAERKHFTNEITT